MPEFIPLRRRDQPTRSALSPFRLGMLAMVFATVGGNVYAQTPGGMAPEVTPAPPPGQDNLTPRERTAENYGPQGIRLGSFMLFPTFELDEMYDDNIFATPAPTTGSFVQVITPGVDLRSNWNRHMLNFFARGSFGFYTADSGLDFQDLSVGTDGRLDITRDSNLYGGASYNRAHYALGTANNPNVVNQITVYNQYSANAGYYQQFNRIRVRLDGRLDAYDFLNNGLGPQQGVAPNSDRDRVELRESLRVGYEFLPGYEIWTRGTLNQRNYNTVPDSQGFDRNSTGWDIVGGFTFGFSQLTSIEVFAGYLQQNYVDPAFPTIAVPTFGLTGNWAPTRQITVKPYVKRTVDESGLADSSAYINTSYGFDVGYNFRPNIEITGHGDYSTANYQISIGSPGRYDQYYTARAGVLYSPIPRFFIGPTYQFVHRTSNQVGQDYNDNQIMLRLGARL
jgi:hypothetical protein